MKWTLEFSEFVIGDDSCKGVGGLGCRICDNDRSSIWTSRGVSRSVNDAWTYSPTALSYNQMQFASVPRLLKCKTYTMLRSNELISMLYKIM